MLYKEWTTVRTKFLIWLVIYVGGAATFLVLRSKGAIPASNDIFQIWASTSLAITLVVAALGGIDVVAEEKASGTLSFLLTRPISRTRIYATKVSLNLATLAMSFVPVSLIMLLIDQLYPARIQQVWSEVQPCGEDQWCTIVHFEEGYTLHSTAIAGGLTTVVLLLLIAAVVVCLSSLVSIFASNTLQAIFVSIPVLALFLVLTSADMYRSYEYYLNGSFSGQYAAYLLLIVAIGSLSFGAGLVAFKRKEF
jgi:ABC-type transport system involved in multi-copper enzyme maturation permease subunit